VSVRLILQALPAGNAVRAHVWLPSSTVSWRLLRKAADTFAGPDDQGATLVVELAADGIVLHTVLDTAGLANGETYYYRAYAWDGAAWTASATGSVVPAATYAGGGTDVLVLLRERIAAGLAVEVARGALRPASGAITVLTAPPLADHSAFPVVTVHLEHEGPVERALGEQIESYLPGGAGADTDEGWLQRSEISVIGWSLNPDERIALRQALRRIVLANLPVLADRGLLLPEWSQQDTEELQAYQVPVYLSSGTFACVSRVWVEAPGAAGPVQIAGVDVSAQTQ
jgi:hypothetical protein